MQPLYDPSNSTSDAALAGWLKNPPPWREMPAPTDPITRSVPLDTRSTRRGETYISTGQAEVDAINTALLLRRPLLVTGAPGLGKSSLAYHLALRLGLGEPLRWEINSRTTLQDGLYTYDAVGHLRATQEGQRPGRPARVGDFVTLGPLGTALLPTPRPRVLLVDELDKSSFDLPNDLLHVFEEGAFVIPEVVRAVTPSKDKMLVGPVDPTSPLDRVSLTLGRVRTWHHPVVVITSNGEREFPEAFRRRCVQLELKAPDDAHIRRIAEAHLGTVSPELEALLTQEGTREATDVFLQALFLHQTFDQSLDAAFDRLRRKRS